MNLEEIETIYSDTIDSIRDGNMKRKDDNLEDDKVAVDFTVTDTTDGQDLTKSLVTVNLKEEKEKPKHIGLGPYSQEEDMNNELYQSKLKNDYDVNKEEKEAEHQQGEENTASVEIASSYRESFSISSDLDDTTVIEEVDQISNDDTKNDMTKMKNPRYLEFSKEQSRKLIPPNLQRSKVFKNIDYDRNGAQNKDWDSKETYNANVGYFVKNKENELVGADKFAGSEELTESEENIHNSQ